MCMSPPQMIWYVSTQTVPSCGATEGFRRVVRLDTCAVHANCPVVDNLSHVLLSPLPQAAPTCGSFWSFYSYDLCRYTLKCGFYYYF